MTQKPTLELTWIEKEGRLRRTPRIRLLDSERSLTGNSPDPVYQGAVQVCPEPTCACCSLQVQYQSILPDGSIASPRLIHEFWLDTWEKSVVLTPELEKNPELLRLANLTRAELSSSDWEQLYQWFRAEKLEIPKIFNRIDRREHKERKPLSQFLSALFAFFAVKFQ